MKVRDLMSQPVRTCHRDQTVNAAAQIMWERDCGIVPIVGEDERLVGVITDRDICMAAFFQNRPLSEIRIGEVMAATISTCRPDDEVIDAEHLMSQRQVHRLPVVNEIGSPVGLLSLADVARRVHTSAGSKKNGVTDLAETIAAICEPHGEFVGQIANRRA